MQLDLRCFVAEPLLNITMALQIDRLKSLQFLLAQLGQLNDALPSLFRILMGLVSLIIGREQIANDLPLGGIWLHKVMDKPKYDAKEVYQSAKGHDKVIEGKDRPRDGLSRSIDFVGNGQQFVLHEVSLEAVTVGLYVQHVSHIEVFEQVEQTVSEEESHLVHRSDMADPIVGVHFKLSSSCIVDNLVMVVKLLSQEPRVIL